MSTGGTLRGYPVVPQILSTLFGGWGYQQQTHAVCMYIQHLRSKMQYVHTNKQTLPLIPLPPFLSMEIGGKLCWKLKPYILNDPQCVRGRKLARDYEYSEEEKLPDEAPTMEGWKLESDAKFSSDSLFLQGWYIRRRLDRTR